MRVIILKIFIFADLNYTCFIFVGILFCNTTILANTHICQHTHTTHTQHTHTHTHTHTTTTFNANLMISSLRCTGKYHEMFPPC